MAVSSGLRPVAELEQLREGIGHLVLVEGVEIALFRTGDQVFAIDARCPHADGPLADGMVCGEVVVCPLHLRRVNLRSAEVEDWPQPVRSYPVVVAGGRVLIALR